MIKPLQPTTPVTQGGDLPSTDLVIIIQQLVREIEALKAQVEALTP